MVEVSGLNSFFHFNCIRCLANICFNLFGFSSSPVIFNVSFLSLMQSVQSCHVNKSCILNREIKFRVSHWLPGSYFKCESNTNLADFFRFLVQNLKDSSAEVRIPTDG